MKVAQACDSDGLMTCATDFNTAVGKARTTQEKCRALSNYNTCFASKSVGCSSNVASSFDVVSNSAKSSFSCETTPADNSASNADAGDSTSNSESNINSVTLVCDT